MQNPITSTIMDMLMATYMSTPHWSYLQRTRPIVYRPSGHRKCRHLTLNMSQSKSSHYPQNCSSSMGTSPFSELPTLGNTEQLSLPPSVLPCLISLQSCLRCSLFCHTLSYLSLSFAPSAPAQAQYLALNSYLINCCGINE